MAVKAKAQAVELEEAAAAVEEATEVVETAEEKLAKATKAARAPVKVAEAGDPNMEMQSILIPINPANKTDLYVTVGLNGKLWKIQRGKTVEVPKALVEIIEHAQQADADAMAYIVQHSE